MAIRQHMSSLKHNIRQKQAQLNSLENIVRSGPRPYVPEVIDDIYTSSSTNLPSSTSTFQGMSSTSSPPPPSSFVSPSSSSGTPTSIKIKRRSSHDVLQSIAGPDSNLPLPKRESITGEDMISGGAGMREGVPMSFSVSNGANYNYKRQSSPTKSLSSMFLFLPFHIALCLFPSAFFVSITAMRSLGIPISSVGKKFLLSCCFQK